MHDGEEFVTAKQKKPNIDCLECGGPLRLVRKDYAFAESGLDNVVLKNLEVLVCDGCKTETPRLPQLNSLMRTIAAALITKPYKLEGQDIRFLRKFLGLNSEAFAGLLDVDRAHLSRVEHGAAPVSATADRLVRLVALGLGEGLEQSARDVIIKFSQIKQPRKLKVLVDAGTRSIQYKAA
jgi:DNA-binding transcriptional regulator YiaG